MLMEESNEEKRIRAKSVERQMIERFLRDKQPGELASYEEVEQLVGESCGPASRVRGLMQNSVLGLIRDRILYECRPNEGYIRLDKDGFAPHCIGRTDRLRRQAKSTVRRAACADMTEVGPTDKALLLSVMIINQAVARMTRSKIVEELAEKHNDEIKSLDIQKALVDRVFRDKKSKT
jgi:hypothetical protein